MRYVTSSDGVRLAVFESGSGATVVAVHGYPDNHTVWDGLTDQLRDRYRVVAYDVRGCGDSDAPKGRAAYRLDRLVGDVAAVVDAVSPDEPVHLLAHDWGSIPSWPALTDPRLRGRIATFTSISGPSLEHAARWLRDVRRHPRDVARQLGMSWYILAFQLPWLPDVAARRGWIDALARRTLPHADPADALHGLQLYRANLLRAGRTPPRRVEDVPVLVIAPDRDPHVSVALQTQAPAPFVAQLRTTVVPGGHWVPVSRPAEIARLVDEFARG